MQPIGTAAQVAQQQATTGQGQQQSNAAQAQQNRQNQTAMGQAFFAIVNRVIQSANENANNQ